MRKSHCPICEKDVSCKDPPDIPKVILEIRRRRIKTCKIGERDGGPEEIGKNKIKKRAEESGIPEADIIKLLKRKDGKMLRWFFYKHPKTQRIAEKRSAEFIEKMTEVENFENLPSTFTKEKQRKWVRDGIVYTFRKFNRNDKAWNDFDNYSFECNFCSKKIKTTIRTETKKKINTHIKEHINSKTIDFEFKRNGYTFYVSHKHTEESGGGQEDFIRELKSFLTDAKSNSRKPKTIFLAIADGDFGAEMLENLRGEQSGLDSNNCSGSFALQSEILPHFLKEHFN